MTGTHHYALVQTHRVYDDETQPLCKFLGDKNCSLLFFFYVLLGIGGNEGKFTSSFGLIGAKEGPFCFIRKSVPHRWSHK